MSDVPTIASLWLADRKPVFSLKVREEARELRVIETYKATRQFPHPFSSVPDGDEPPEDAA